MLDKKVEEALNGQLNAELFASYLYLSMAAYFKARGLDGFSAWMNAQMIEEMTHAKRFYDFINRRGGKVLLTELAAPETEWASPLAAFESALDHEQKVTAMIDGLVDLAEEKKDHGTAIFLQWFVTEQIEEEESFGGVVNLLKMTSETGEGILMLDREMGQRAPAATLAQDE